MVGRYDKITSVALCKREKKVKVKVTLVQALRLCTGRTAHRESRGIEKNVAIIPLTL